MRIGDGRTASQLHQRDGDFGARMDDGKTPADLARDRGHPETAKLLDELAPQAPEGLR